MLETGMGILVGLWWASHRLKRGHAETSRTAFEVALEGRWAYWLQDGQLVRAPMLAGVVEVDSVEVVDPLLSADLTPVEVIEILEVLEGDRSTG